MAENVNVVAEDPGTINRENINPVLRALYKFGSFFGFGNKLYASNKQRKKVFFDVIVYIILIFGSIIMLYPFYWMVMASFNASTQDVLKTVWWPKSITEGGIFTNYVTIIRDFETRVGSGANYWRIVFNTIIYSTVPVIVGVVVSAAAAFAFAKIDFKGKNVVFFYCLAAIMIPAAVPCIALSVRALNFPETNTTAAPSAVINQVKSVANKACNQTGCTVSHSSIVFLRKIPLLPVYAGKRKTVLLPEYPFRFFVRSWFL